MNVVSLARTVQSKTGAVGLVDQFINWYVWDHNRPHSIPGLFVVSGRPRSGTTLLGALLGNHPGLTLLLEPYRSSWMSGTIKHDGKVWSHHPTETVRKIAGLGRPVGIKETDFPAGEEWSNHQFLEAAIQADIPVVYIVRDPRDVWVSTMEYRRLPEDSLPTERFCEAWNLSVDFGHRCACFVSYTQLVTNTDSTMRRVCDAIGVPFDPAVITPERRSGVGDTKAVAGNAITTDSVGRYQGRVSDEAVDMIERWCGTEMERLGFPIEARPRVRDDRKADGGEAPTPLPQPRAQSPYSSSTGLPSAQ